MPVKPPPSATVTIGEKVRPVVFDLDCILRIEEATGRPALDIVGMIFAPGEDVRSAGRRILQRVPLGVVIDFVAGALGVHADQAQAWAAEGQIYKAFLTLVPAFVQAADQLLGALGADQESAAAGPTQAAALEGQPPGQPLATASGPVA